MKKPFLDLSYTIFASRQHIHIISKTIARRAGNAALAEKRDEARIIASPSFLKEAKREYEIILLSLTFNFFPMNFTMLPLPNVLINNATESGSKISHSLNKNSLLLPIIANTTMKKQKLEMREVSSLIFINLEMRRGRSMRRKVVWSKPNICLLYTSPSPRD